MREIRPSGSEGGVTLVCHPYPYLSLDSQILDSMAKINTYRYYVIAKPFRLFNSFGARMPVTLWSYLPELHQYLMIQFCTRLLCGLAVGAAALMLAASPVRASSPGGAAGSLPTKDAWPMFRGSPGLVGVASGRLPESPALLWTFKTGGPVKSSAAIAQGRVFAGSEDGHVYALDLANGQKLWAFKTGGPIESSPLFLEGKVFVGSSDTYLYAIDAARGTEVWKYQTGEKILGAPNWIKDDKSGTPWILAGSYDYKLHCVDAATGKAVWTYETGNYINGSPAVGGGKTMFGGCDALLHVIRLQDGQKIKEVEAGAYIAGSGAVVGDRVYIGQYENEFLCIDTSQGNIVWRYKDRPFPFFSSPAVANDRVVFGGRDKRLHCVQRSDGKPVWTFTTRGKVDSSPVVCGDRVVVGSDDGRLYVVSLAAGKELWSYEVGQPIGSSPAVVEGKIVIGADDGNVYAFGAKTPAKGTKEASK